MSDFIKKFKSIFVVEDDGATAADPTQPTAQAPVAANPAPESPSVSSGSVSDKFMDILMSALDKNNQDGFDYLEFRQALKNLAKMPMDEATRYQSAYAMAQTMGVTPAKLIESGKFYLNVLSSEQARFNEAHAQQRTKLIGNREEEIKSLESAILEKTEQIKQLTQQIEEHRQRSEQVRKEISESTVKIENTKADFEATYQAVSGQIEDDLGKIQQHLK